MPYKLFRVAFIVIITFTITIITMITIINHYL